MRRFNANISGWLLALGLAATLGLRAAAVRADERPNFVLIIADDVSAHDLGCYGHPHVKTPHLDALAAGGLKLSRAFLTCSSCSPSRASIITSRYPHNTGAGELHQPLPVGQVTVARQLKDEGYYVACAGKWHLGEAAKKDFDLVVGGNPSGCELWVKTLAERPRDQPFLLWLAALDAHRPYQKNSIPGPHQFEDAIVPPYFPDTPAVRGDLNLYYDEISRLDDYVGQVMAEIKRQGTLDNTVVMFIADNGRPFPRCKTTLYDSGIQTPAIVHWPKSIKPGSVSDSLVSSIDIAPTFLELAGVALPKEFQGESFAKVLRDPRAAHRDAIFAEHNWHDYAAHQRAVRTERYLYIRNELPQYPRTPPADAVRSPTYAAMQSLHAEGKLSPQQATCFTTPAPREELYDVISDPHSLKNLAQDEKHAATRDALRRRLAKWAEETKDAVPPQPTPDKFDRATGLPLK